MAFNVENAKVTKSLPLVYGICKGMKLLPYVNLNNEEKQKLGIKTFEKESEYIIEKEKDGKNFLSAIIELYTKIEICNVPELQGAIFPIRFYIDDTKGKVSSTGKIQYINKFGETSWLLSPEDEENSKYLSSKEELREAYVGEADLMDALKSMFHISSGIETFKWDNVFKKKDFSEIKSTIKNAYLYIQGKLIPEQNKNIEKPFDVLFYVTSKTKEIEGNIKTFYIQNLYTKGFNERKIRKTIEQNELNYPLQGFYKKDGIITNYLNVFEGEIDSSNQQEKNISDLPF